MIVPMEKDPDLEDFVRRVRGKPEVRLPCADCGQLLYLTVAQCPHCKGKSVLKKCGWCQKEMRLFFSLADRQLYCEECEWKLNREQIRCAACGKPIAVDEPYVTFARRLMHPACKEAADRAAPPGAGNEEAQAARQMDEARRQLAAGVQRQFAGAAAPPPEPEKKGCAAAVILALLGALLLR